MGRTGYLTPSVTTKAVGATSIKVCDALPASSGITYRLFQNASEVDIYLGLGKAAELNKGIMVAKEGGTYEMYLAKGNLYSGEITAISTGSSNNLLFVQG